MLLPRILNSDFFGIVQREGGGGRNALKVQRPVQRGYLGLGDCGALAVLRCG